MATAAPGKLSPALIGAAVWIVLMAIMAIGALMTRSWLSTAAFLASGLVVIPTIAANLRARGVRDLWRRLGSAALFFVGVIAMNTEADLKVAEPAPAANAPAKAAVAPAPAATRSPAAAVKTAYTTLFRQTLSTAKPCDDAISQLGDAATNAQRTGSMVQLYTVARDGQQTCQNAWMALSRFDEPGDLTDEQEAIVEKNIETCHSAYFLRQRAMETAMKMADGDTKASTIVSFKDDLNAGQSGVLACVAGWIGNSEKFGVPAKEMKVS